MFADKQIKAAAQALLDFDESAHELFEGGSGTPLARAIDLFSKLGDQPEIRWLSGAVILAGILRDDDRMTRAGSRMILAHEAATAAKDVIKTEIDRTRPRSASRREEKKPKKGRHQAKEMTSFPSGHSAGAAAAALAFSREYPQLRAGALAFAGLVAASQVPRRAHYPTDIAAGLVLGFVAEALVDLAWRAADIDERSDSGRLERT